MERFLWICLAGALGTGTRYLVGVWAIQRWGTEFVSSLSPNLRLALTTGFMGGLTTYSSFNYETTRLLQQGARNTARLNVGLTLVSCFAAGLCGLWLTRRLLGT